MDFKGCSKEQCMAHVACKISDGLGNRFFQVAAMLGYAEKHSGNPVFVKEWFVESNHPGPKSVLDFFPSIPTIPLVSDWVILNEPGEKSYTYLDLPAIPSKNVKLNGFFQSEKYFPSRGLSRPLILNGLDDRYTNYAFLHIRRGDYLLPVCKHHAVNLDNYYRYALSFFSGSDTRIVVCSDDMEWCEQTLPARYKDLVSADRWEFLPSSTTDFETLRLMTACGKGGIAANSTFSWWGAYWNVGRQSGAGITTMPAVWGSPPLPDAVDLHPPWATVLPI
jgi:hypothetical protein